MTLLLPKLGAPPFRDRREAGRRLGACLGHLREENPVVIGLPRGGVPVAWEVASALDAPLDVAIVRKLGAPFQPEYAIGAIGEEEVAFLNPDAVGIVALSDQELELVISREQSELERRRLLYRGDRPPLPVRGRTVILVDDGIATGASASAAARILRRRGAARVVVAVPVGPPGAGKRFGDEVDDFVCLEAPDDFFAIGPCYEHFEQTSDEEVEKLLRRARERGRAAEHTAVAATPGEPAPRILGGIDLSRTRTLAVQVSEGALQLPGDLRLPPSPIGLVIFAHGSGSSRLSPRNVQVAAALNGARLATLLFDLLTEAEASDRRNVFDIELLRERLVAATRWAQREPALRRLPIGYFGSSTGAAAALCAAADLGGDIRAVVSRGGRPDLAERRLAQVTAPTLLIVGGEDRLVVELNEAAAASLRCPHRLEIVAGATHLFEEPGALEQVAGLAARWFGEQFGALPASDPAARAPISTQVAAVVEFLDAHGIDYELVEHEATMTAVAEADATHRPHGEVAKTVVLQDHGHYVLAIVPASERVDLHKLRHLLEATKSLRLATEQEIAGDIPMLEVGAVPPIGPMRPASEVVDQRLLGEERILCAGGDHRHSVVLDPRDVVRIGDAKVADICID